MSGRRAEGRRDRGSEMGDGGCGEGEIAILGSQELGAGLKRRDECWIEKWAAV